MQYFSGRREVGKVFSASDAGRTQISCTIFESWIDIDHSTTARCGAKGACQLVRSIGLSEKSALSLETSLESSIGLAGIVSLKSTIKETTGIEVNWTRAASSTKSFEFNAPKCGRSTYCIYQLYREYEISYTRRHMFSALGKSPIVRVIKLQELTNTHDMFPDIVNYDEVCNCPKENDGQDFTSIIVIDLGKISLRVPYRLSPIGFEIQILQNIFSIKYGGAFPLVDFLEKRRSITLPSKILPEPLLFLGEITEEFVDARIYNFDEDPTDEESEDTAMFEIRGASDIKKTSL